MIEFIKIFLVLIASFIAAYTDYKTSYIYDSITYPLIGVGLIILLIQSFFINNPLGLFYFFKVLLISGLIYGIGYIFYYFGKLGGGDIKLFIGINLVMPYFNGELFILWVLLASSLLSVFFQSIIFLYKLTKKINIFKTILKHKVILLKSILIFILFSVFFIYSMNILSLPKYYFLILLIIFFGLINLVLEQEIKKYIYMVKKDINNLEEGDVLAVEFIRKDILNKLNLKNKQILDKKDIDHIKTLNIKSLKIYDNLPRFGPYIFLGIVFVLLFL